MILKAGREQQKLLIQQWTLVGGSGRSHTQQLEEVLHRFERFQFAR